MPKRLAISMLALLCALAPAHGEFRFSTQIPLTSPDPFLKPKPKPAAAPKPGAAVKPATRPPRMEKTVADTRLAAFPPSMAVDAVARLTLDLTALKLVREIELHFARGVEIVSGCRTHRHNLEVGGAPRSFHLSCLAADIRIEGLAPEKIRDFALALNGRGGVGTYCGMDIVHIDTGPKRQWHRPCGEPDWRDEEGDELAMK